MTIHNRHMRQIATCVLGACVLTSCSPVSQKVSYGDAGAAQALSTDFGSSDLQQIASSLVDSLVIFPPIVEITASRRPVIQIDQIKNKTRQHIDTEGITDSIKSKLLRTGKFRFTDRGTDDAVIEEVRWQQESGLYKKSSQQQFGGHIGSEYLLTGKIMEIAQRSGRLEDVYYKFTLELRNLSTGIIEWSDEKEIRKMSERSLVGW